MHYFRTFAERIQKLEMEMRTFKFITNTFNLLARGVKNSLSFVKWNE